MSAHLAAALLTLLLLISLLNAQIYRGNSSSREKLIKFYSHSVLFSVSICRDSFEDYELTCPDQRQLIVNGYDTRHSPTSSAIQLCDCDSRAQRCDPEFNLPGSATDLQNTCDFRGGRSKCLLTQASLQLYFLARQVGEQSWNPVPKRIQIKYSCSGSNDFC
jgi:hypothetical protein